MLITETGVDQLFEVVKQIRNNLPSMYAIAFIVAAHGFSYIFQFFSNLKFSKFQPLWESAFPSLSKALQIWHFELTIVYQACMKFCS